MHSFIAPYARGHGLARMLTDAGRGAARANSAITCSTSTCARRRRRRSALRVAGLRCAGACIRTTPACAASTVRGFFYYKRLRRPSRKAGAERPNDAPALTLYPAIDLKDGALRPAAPRRDGRGDGLFRRSRRRRRGPGRRRASRWLHVVDLERRLRRQAGERRGGRRDPGRRARSRCSSAAASATWPASSAWLAAGIRRVILGSAAAKNPALVREACRAFPGRIVVGIDARDGVVATEGWAETSTMRAPTSRCASRTPAWRRSSTPTSAATAC